MNFIGRYYHTLEQKGRLSIPKAFRNSLGETAIISRGLDGCLFLFHLEQWQKVTSEATSTSFTHKKSRDWVRLLANNANEVEFDRLGRISIPEYLKTAINLKKEVVVVGSIDRIEIWDQSTYHQYLENLVTNAESIAESLEGN